VHGRDATTHEATAGCSKQPHFPTAHVKLTSTPLTGPGNTDNSVQSDRTYCYVVTALNTSDQESAFSSEVTAIVP
jgi:hypothetical protein